MTKLRPGARIEGRTLSDADWAEADLADLVLVGCQVEDAIFSNTCLQGAKFERCRLIRCRFPHSDLREASFSDCAFADPASQKGAAFNFTRLEETRFSRCDLTHARFEGAEMHAVRLEDCNLLGAVFHRVSF